MSKCVGGIVNGVMVDGERREIPHGCEMTWGIMNVEVEYSATRLGIGGVNRLLSQVAVVAT